MSVYLSSDVKSETCFIKFIVKMYHIQIKKTYFWGSNDNVRTKTPSDFQAYISPVFFKHRALSIKTKLFQRIVKYHFSSLYDRFH